MGLRIANDYSHLRASSSVLTLGKLVIMFGTLKNNEIEELLHQQFIGRIGCHAEGITYVVPVSYAYDGEYIYGHTFEGMKVKMMRKNPKVCFQVDDMHNMANWKSIIAWGEFEELAGGQERSYALQQLIDRTLPLISSETMHLTPQWPFPATDIKNITGIVYRVRLESKTGRFEESSADHFFAT